MKAKELIEELKKYPEDIEILTLNSNTMEQSGYSKNCNIRKYKMFTERRETYDAFDYEPYSYEYIGICFNDNKENTFDALIIG